MADWIQREIATGFQKLVCLGLERTPSADLLPGTVMAWREAILNGRRFDEAEDVQRFRKAFAVIAGTFKSWPAPRDFVEALPSKIHQREVPRLENPEARDRVLQQMQEFRERMRFGQPEKHVTPKANLKPIDDFARCCEKGTREKPVCDECKVEMEALHGPVRKFGTQEGII